MEVLELSGIDHNGSFVVTVGMEEVIKVHEIVRMYIHITYFLLCFQVIDETMKHEPNLIRQGPN